MHSIQEPIVFVITIKAARRRRRGRTGKVINIFNTFFINTNTDTNTTSLTTNSEGASRYRTTATTEAMNFFGLGQCFGL